MIVIVDIDRSTSLRYGDGSKPHYYIIITIFWGDGWTSTSYLEAGIPGFWPTAISLSNSAASRLLPAPTKSRLERGEQILVKLEVPRVPSASQHRATGFGHVENPIIMLRYPKIWQVGRAWSIMTRKILLGILMYLVYFGLLFGLLFTTLTFVTVQINMPQCLVAGRFPAGAQWHRDRTDACCERVSSNFQGPTF